MLNVAPPTGPLDDVNVYVAELLLDLSTEIDVYDFSLRYQVRQHCIIYKYVLCIPFKGWVCVASNWSYLCYLWLSE